jgi:uncharacterized protein
VIQLENETLADAELDPRVPADVRARIAIVDPIAQANAARLNEVSEKHHAELAVKFKAIQTPGTPRKIAMKRLRGFASSWGHDVAKVAACRSGCAHCCHISVAMAPLEAEIIGEAIGRPPAPGPGRVSHDYGYHRPCVFLGKDNRCTIYKDRPLACRVHFNLDNDNLLCRLIPGVSIPVPYANAGSIQELYVMLCMPDRLSDIHDFFPPK